VATLADKIDDRPAVFTSLEMVETEVGKLSSSETATEKDGNDRSVALALEAFGIGGLPQVTSFLCGQPISQPNAEFLNTFYAADAGGEFWTEASLRPRPHTLNAVPRPASR